MPLIILASLILHFLILHFLEVRYSSLEHAITTPTFTLTCAIISLFIVNSKSARKYLT